MLASAGKGDERSGSCRPALRLPALSHVCSYNPPASGWFHLWQPISGSMGMFEGTGRTAARFTIADKEITDEICLHARRSIHGASADGRPFGHSRLG